MTGYVGNLEEQTLSNQSFRKVLFTSTHGQLVVMSLLPNEEIGEEVHTVDQFFRIEKGQAKVIMNGEESIVSDGFAIVVPAGTNHNIINTSATERLQLYTIYMPAQHRDGVEHKTKAEGEADQTDHV
ncbi:MAG TPA: cupin domain-containing protein [Candidatus Dojkabacteria bacterium]|nr:cupin domain-containing protein [Candidatus Dojkabacteria bacterium]